MWARWLSTVRSLTVGVREVHAERRQILGQQEARGRPGRRHDAADDEALGLLDAGLPL